MESRCLGSVGRTGTELADNRFVDSNPECPNPNHDGKCGGHEADGKTDHPENEREGCSENEACAKKGKSRGEGVTRGTRRRLLEGGGHTKPSIGERDRLILPAEGDSLEDRFISFREMIHRESRCSFGA